MSHSLIILFAFIQTPGARLVPCLKLVIQRTCHDSIGDIAKVVPRLRERGFIQLPFSNPWHLLSTFSCSQLHWRHLFRWQQVVAAFWLLMVVLFLFVCLFFAIVLFIPGSLTTTPSQAMSLVLDSSLLHAAQLQFLLPSWIQTRPIRPVLGHQIPRTKALVLCSLL